MRHEIDPSTMRCSTCQVAHPYANGTPAGRSGLVVLNDTGACALAMRLVPEEPPRLVVSGVLHQHQIGEKGQCSCGHQHPPVPERTGCYSVHYAVVVDSGEHELEELLDGSTVVVRFRAHDEAREF